ncbi:Transposon Tf2-9 polyprotein [Exaiptasia diaphana]|nr:Transposon Tf2-9 polyprotein [Exaiptasia diaphana]
MKLMNMGLLGFNAVLYYACLKPFGIRSAQEVFHNRLHELMYDLAGVETDIDDILVWGRTKTEHDERLYNVLKRSRECNLKLNPDKCKIRKTEVTYIGHRLTKDGVKPDNSKIEAIVNMPAPQDKKGVQRLLGMINYLAKFIPNLSAITAPLHELLKEQTAWHWTQLHDEALQEIKNLLSESSCGVLKYYEPAKPVKLQVDACKSGLGAVLLQHERPVAYTSRALTDAECRYAQIEKDQAPARLQRMLLCLQRYGIKLIFKPGKEMYAADTLCRVYLTTQTKDDEELITYISSVTTSLPVSDHKLLKLQQETSKDTELLTLTNLTKEGWPLHKDGVPLEVRQYWPVRNQLTVDNSLVMKGEEIVIPSSMRREVLSKIHEGHLSIVRSKLRAKEAVYWPGMLNQIEDLITSCNTCQELRNNNQKEPLIPHEIPSYPWQAVATDLFTWNNFNYLVVVDYYSRYWEISSLNTTSSASIVSKLKSTFAQDGIPVVKSDNGPQYSPAEFATFANEWGFCLYSLDKAFSSFRACIIM